MLPVQFNAGDAVALENTSSNTGYTAPSSSRSRAGSGSPSCSSSCSCSTQPDGPDELVDLVRQEQARLPSLSELAFAVEGKHVTGQRSRRMPRLRHQSPVQALQRYHAGSLACLSSVRLLRTVPMLSLTRATNRMDARISSTPSFSHWQSSEAESYIRFERPPVAAQGKPETSSTT